MSIESELLYHKEICWKDESAPWIRKPNWLANVATVLTIIGMSVAVVTYYMMQQSDQNQKSVFLETKVEYNEKILNEVKEKMNRIEEVSKKQDLIIDEMRSIRREMRNRP